MTNTFKKLKANKLFARAAIVAGFLILVLGVNFVFADRWPLPSDVPTPPNPWVWQQDEFVQPYSSNPLEGNVDDLLLTDSSGPQIANSRLNIEKRLEALANTHLGLNLKTDGGLLQDYTDPLASPIGKVVVGDFVNSPPCATAQTDPLQCTPQWALDHASDFFSKLWVLGEARMSSPGTWDEVSSNWKYPANGSDFVTLTFTNTSVDNILGGGDSEGAGVDICYAKTSTSGSGRDTVTGDSCNPDFATREKHGTSASLACEKLNTLTSDDYSINRGYFERPNNGNLINIIPDSLPNGQYQCADDDDIPGGCIDIYIDRKEDIMGDGVEGPVWAERTVVCNKNSSVSNGTSYGLSNRQGNLKIATSTDAILTFRQNGNVGISTTSPSTKLSVEGTIAVEGVRYPTGPVQTSANSVPVGTIAYFTTIDTSTAIINPMYGCPNSWARLDAASGRYLVSLPKNGVSGSATGTALAITNTSSENRPVGLHGHVPSNAQHAHQYNKFGTTDVNDKQEANFVDDQSITRNTGIKIINGGLDSYGISVTAGTNNIPGTPAPYIQYLVCKKQ